MWLALSGAGDGLETQLPAAPGGFVESAADATIRPVPNALQIAAFLPTTRSSFTFPAPYGTQAYRLTLPDDCGGQDCVTSVGYSYWRNINNHRGSNTILIVITLDRDKGGGGPTLFSIDKRTGSVTKIGPLFDPADALSFETGEGWYFSGTAPSILYHKDQTRLVRLDVLTKTSSTVFDIGTATGLFGSPRLVWQTHSSQDDHVHSFTVRVDDGDNYEAIGCGVYLETRSEFRFYPRTLAEFGAFDECQIDKSGRWLVIKEQIDGRFGNDNRIIDLETNAETQLLDENGAPGHSDTGFGYFVGEDDWNDAANAMRLWRFGTSPLGPGTVVASWPTWDADGHLSHSNALNADPAKQYACWSGANRLNGPRTNEISCWVLDGSRRPLVVAPVMVDLDAPGGGDDYSKMPKGNLDVTGQYFIWTSNMGSSRQDAFVVRVPAQLLDLPPVSPPTNLRIVR